MYALLTSRTYFRYGRARGMRSKTNSSVNVPTRSMPDCQRPIALLAFGADFEQEKAVSRRASKPTCSTEQQPTVGALPESQRLQTASLQFMKVHSCNHRANDPVRNSWCRRPDVTLQPCTGDFLCRRSDYCRRRELRMAHSPRDCRLVFSSISK